MRFLFLAAALLGPAAASAQQAEKQLVVTISGPELRGGILSEITWDNGELLLQGVFAEPNGTLKPYYYLVPAQKIRLEQREEQTDASVQYWLKKANRLSPTGLGRITSKSDTKMPQFGIGTR